MKNTPTRKPVGTVAVSVDEGKYVRARRLLVSVVRQKGVACVEMRADGGPWHAVQLSRRNAFELHDLLTAAASEIPATADEQREFGQRVEDMVYRAVEGAPTDEEA